MFVSHLRKIMAENKIDDVTELMKMTNVSRNSINKLYRELDIETLKLDTLAKICNAFNIELSELIEYIPSPPK